MPSPKKIGPKSPAKSKAAKPAKPAAKPAAVSKPPAVSRPVVSKPIVSKTPAAPSQGPGGLPLTRRQVAAYDTASPAFVAAHKKIADAFRRQQSDRDGGLYADVLFSDKDSQKWWT